MAPDYPYFLTLSDGIRWGHSWRGVFLFCMPVGLALLWLFHGAVKRPLVSLAPEFLRQGISEGDLQFRFSPTRRLLLIVSSLFIGTLTHVLWDGFTHENGYFVKHWPVLSTPVMLHHVVPLWKALQFLCTAAGLILIAAMAIWWWSRKPVARNPVTSRISPSLRWCIIGIIIVLGCGAGIAGGYPILHSNWRVAVVQAVIYGISAICVEVVLFSLAWHAVGVGRNEQTPLDTTVQRLNAPVER